MFSTFQHHWQSISKSPKRQSTGNINCSSMVYTTMISGGNGSKHFSSNIDQSQERPVTFTRDTRCSSSTAEAFESFGSFFVRTALRNKEFQEDTWAVIRCSWRDSTRSHYDSALLKWLSYCSERSVDTSNPDIAYILSFLTHLYNTGLSYSSTSTVTSVLSNVVFIPDINKIADHPLVKRLMGGREFLINALLNPDTISLGTLP